MNEKTQCTWHWQVEAYDVSKWAYAGIKGHLWNMSSSFFQRGCRQECPKHGQETQRLVPYSQGTMVTCVTWDVPFRRELYAASSRGRYGNAISTPPCWGMSVRIAGFLSHRLEEHHPCPADLESKPLYRQAQSLPSSLRVWLSEWRSQESDSLDWAETSTLDAINS